MKTNNLRNTLVATAVGALLLAAASRATANNLPTVATVISYLAVIGLVTVAVNDYRGAAKGYFVR